MKIKLINTKNREEFLNTFPHWPVWWSVPEVKLTVRRFDLPGGFAVIAAQYENDYSGGSNPRWQFIRPGGHFSSVYACSSNVIVGELLRLGHIDVEVPTTELINKKKWSVDQVAELHKMCMDGVSNADMAKHFGVPVTEIYTKRSQLGITIPKVAAMKEDKPI